MSPVTWHSAADALGQIESRREAALEQWSQGRLNFMRSLPATGRNHAPAPVQPPLLSAIPSPRRVVRNRLFTDAEARRLCELVAQGLSRAEAADALGWTWRTLWRRIRLDEDLLVALDAATSRRRRRSTSDRHGTRYFVQRSGKVYVSCHCEWKPDPTSSTDEARALLAEHFEAASA